MAWLPMRPPRVRQKSSADRTNYQEQAMSYYRTPEHRKRQAELIRTWRPWERATGPKSPEGKAVAARNAYKGGIGAELRRLRAQINALLREQRELV